MQKKRIPFYVSWESRPLIYFSLTFLFVLAILGLFFIPNVIHSYKINRLEGETLGQIVGIQENFSMHQGRYGNRNVVDSYTLRFAYQVNGTEFFGQEKIPAIQKNALFFKRLFKNEGQALVLVKYNIQKPRQSMVLLKAVKKEADFISPSDWE